MKIVDFKIVQEEFEGHKYLSLYAVLEDKKVIRIGTIKGTDNLYLVTAQKKEYK